MSAFADEIVQREQRLLGRVRKQRPENFDHHSLRVFAGETVG
jgi:hypothetical protein